MQTVKRFFEDCPACENRGLICVGDDDQDFPCAHCNGWCSLCLEQPLAGRNGRPLLGSLLAAVRRTNVGLELLEGFVCDFHCGVFSRAVVSTPAMIGRLKPGDAFLLVQGQLLATHAFVELYGYAEAENWHELEADAFAAAAEQRWSPYGRHGFYVCPPELAARARVPAWVTWQVGEMVERRILPSRARLGTWAIVEE
jgi:hypothetical protein